MARRPGQEAVKGVFNDSWVELGEASTLTTVRVLISRGIELFNESSFFQSAVTRLRCFSKFWAALSLSVKLSAAGKSSPKDGIEE